MYQFIQIPDSFLPLSARATFCQRVVLVVNNEGYGTLMLLLFYLQWQIYNGGENLSKTHLNLK